MSDSNDILQVGETATVSDCSNVCTTAKEWADGHGLDTTLYDGTVWLRDGDEVKILYSGNNNDVYYVQKDNKTALIFARGLKAKDDISIKPIEIILPIVTNKTLNDNLLATLSPIVKNKAALERKIRDINSGISYGKADIETWKESIISKTRSIDRMEGDKIQFLHQLEKIELIDVTGAIQKIKNSLSALPIKSVYTTIDGDYHYYLFLTDNLKISPIQMLPADFDNLISDEFDGSNEDSDSDDDDDGDGIDDGTIYDSVTESYIPVGQYFKDQVGKTLGHYAIFLRYHDGWQLYGFNLDNRALYGYDSCCISNGSFCWGNLSDNYFKQANDNNIAGILELAIDQITSPTHSNNPYIIWTKFFDNLKPTTYYEICGLMIEKWGDSVLPLFKAFGSKTLSKLIDNELKANRHSYTKRQLNRYMTNIINSANPTRIL